MTKFFISLSFIFLSTFSFSQISYPDVYCNGKKIKNGKVESFFTPSELDFRFNKSDTTYVIKNGFVVFKGYSIYDTVKLTSNHIRKENVIPSKSIDVIINEVEVMVKDKIVRIDTNTLTQTIQIATIPMNEHEAEYINKNKVILTLNNVIIDSYKLVSIKEVNEWSISIVDDFTALLDFDLILVRGNRPIATEKIEGKLGTERRFRKYVQKGDYILIRVYEKNSPKIVYNKVVFVKLGD